LPFGQLYDQERFFFIVPDQPLPETHDTLFRRWAEQYTPYPVPPNLSLHNLLQYEGVSTDAPVLLNRGRAVVQPDPWTIAFTPEALESALKEVSHAP